MSKKEIKLIDRVEVFDTELNIYGSFDEPYFMAKEVADWIDYGKTGKGVRNVTKMIKNLDEDVIEKFPIRLKRDTGKNNYQEMIFISENGLYDLLMISRNKKAKSFKKEVRKILKRIRKQNGQLVFNDDSLLLHQITELKHDVKQSLDLIGELLNTEEINKLKTDTMFIETALKERFDNMSKKDFKKWLTKLNMFDEKTDAIRYEYTENGWFAPLNEDNGKLIDFMITEFGIIMIRVLIKNYNRRHNVLHLRKKNK